MSRLISVVMTVRNGAAYIQAALDSLIAQTDPDFEVVVIDDGSSDGTAEILRKQSDPRIIVHLQPQTGRAETLAEAVRVARAELIAVLDADDIALPHRLEVQRGFMDSHPEIALVGSSAIEFDGSREWRRGEVSGPQRVRRALGMHNPFYHSSVMFRRSAYEAVGGYRPDGGWGHDKDLLIRIAARFQVDIISEPLIKYRRHAGQITADRAGESFRRQKSAALQLKAARELKLSPVLWAVPILGWIYAHSPAILQPRQIKDPLKRLLLRLSGVAAPPSNGERT
jgi:glycosyltransferase involved in cell wall biosynthesis